MTVITSVVHPVLDNRQGLSQTALVERGQMRLFGGSWV